MEINPFVELLIIFAKIFLNIATFMFIFLQIAIFQIYFANILQNLQLFSKYFFPLAGVVKWALSFYSSVAADTKNS